MPVQDHLLVQHRIPMQSDVKIPIQAEVEMPVKKKALVPFQTPVPIQVPIQLSQSMLYAQDTSFQCAALINIAQAVKSSTDLHDCILKHLPDSNLDQHKVFMTIEYLKDMMSRQNVEYSSEKRKIDDEFDSFTFTDAQNTMLNDYLPNLYMNNDNSDIEHKFFLSI